MALYRCMGATEKPTLLWTNPSPTSSFSSLTLDFSKEDYPFILIEYKETSGSSNLYRTCIERNQGDNAYYGFLTQGSNGNWVRIIVEHLTSFSITGCYKVNATDTSSNRNIPTRIYGYKKPPYNI